VLTAQPPRGFTLPEIMLSTVLLLIVSGAVYQLLTTTQRLSRAQAEHIAVQSSVRGGSLLVPNELKESSPGDLLSIGGSEVTFRAMRGIGFLCQAASTTQIQIGRTEFSGHRDPQAGRDSAYVFLEGAPETDLDDSWLPVAVTQVSGNSPCPGNGGPGIALTVSSPASLVGIPAGTPVRTYEILQLKLYRSEGESWLGARSVSAGEAVQPVVGPLTDGNGFRLEYLDGANVPTQDLATIKSIRVTVRGISEDIVPVGGGAVLRVEEELINQVALRNVPRP
jgi:prepilin-type N-terminal cleavage/methylation domain-containing protein